MREHEHIVVVVEILAHDVVGEVIAVANRKLDFSLGVHDVDGSHFEKSAFLDRLLMIFRIHAHPLVGGVAFDESAVEALHERLHQIGIEIIGLLAFTCGDLHSDAAMGLRAESLVDLYQILGSDVFDEIDGRDLHAVGVDAFGGLLGKGVGST